MSLPKMATSRGRSTNGASARNTKRHFGQSPHQRAVPPCSRNARLHEVTTGSYRSIGANIRAMCSSEKGRSSEKYRPGSPACAASATANPASAASDLDHWWLISTPCQTVFGEDAERSLDISTGPSPCSTAVATEISEL